MSRTSMRILVTAILGTAWAKRVDRFRMDVIQVKIRTRTSPQVDVEAMEAQPDLSVLLQRSGLACSPASLSFTQKPSKPRALLWCGRLTTLQTKKRERKRARLRVLSVRSRSRSEQPTAHSPWNWKHPWWQRQGCFSTKPKRPNERVSHKEHCYATAWDIHRTPQTNEHHQQSVYYGPESKYKNKTNCRVDIADVGGIREEREERGTERARDGGGKSDTTFESNASRRPNQRGRAVRQRRLPVPFAYVYLNQRRRALAWEEKCAVPARGARPPVHIGGGTLRAQN